MSARLGLVAGGLVGLAIACASQPRPATAPAPTMPGESTSGPHDQIQQLANQIDADRVQLNLPVASPMADHDGAAGAGVYAFAVGDLYTDLHAERLDLSQCEADLRSCESADERLVGRAEVRRCQVDMCDSNEALL